MNRTLNNKIRSDRGKPYDRPQVPTRPQSGKNVSSSTRQGFLSRFTNLFSYWKQKDLPDSGQTNEEDVGHEVQSNGTSTKPIFSYPSPEIPDIASISPNERLANFFRQKGDEKLSDVETEGVISLIRQAYSQNEALIDLDPSRLGVLKAPSRTITRSPFQTPVKLPNTSTEPRHEISMSYHTPPASTPIPASSPALSLTYTPMYTPSKKTQLLSSAVKPRTSTPLGLSAPWKESPANTTFESPQIRSVKPTKPRSQTAASLASILDSVNAPKSLSRSASDLSGYNDIPTQLLQIPASPYSSARRSNKSPYSVKKGTEHRSQICVNNSRDKIAEKLQQSMPVNQAGPEYQKSNSTSILKSSDTKKYKPVRSSSLRQTLIASSDHNEANLHDAALAPTQKDISSTNLFTFTGSNKQSRDEKSLPTSIDRSASVKRSESLPAFDFSGLGIAPMHTPAPQEVEKHRSNFVFSGLDCNINT